MVPLHTTVLKAFFYFLPYLGTSQIPQQARHDNLCHFEIIDENGEEEGRQRRPTDAREQTREGTSSLTYCKTLKD